MRFVTYMNALYNQYYEFAYTSHDYTPCKLISVICSNAGDPILEFMWLGNPFSIVESTYIYTYIYVCVHDIYFAANYFLCQKSFSLMINIFSNTCCFHLFCILGSMLLLLLKPAAQAKVGKTKLIINFFRNPTCICATENWRKHNSGSVARVHVLSHSWNSLDPGVCASLN